MKERHLNCEFCGTLTETKIVELKATRDGREFVSQIEAEVCPNCKEEYYEGESLLQFEEMIEKSLAPV